MYLEFSGVSHVDMFRNTVMRLVSGFAHEVLAGMCFQLENMAIPTVSKSEHHSHYVVLFWEKPGVSGDWFKKCSTFLERTWPE